MYKKKIDAILPSFNNKYKRRTHAKHSHEKGNIFFTTTVQKTDSAERDRCIGCDGLRAKRFFGNLSSMFNNRTKSGRSPGRNDQHNIRISLKKKNKQMKNYEVGVLFLLL